MDYGERGFISETLNIPVNSSLSHTDGNFTIIWLPYSYFVHKVIFWTAYKLVKQNFDGLLGQPDNALSQEKLKNTN